MHYSGGSARRGAAIMAARWLSSSRRHALLLRRLARAEAHGSFIEEISRYCSGNALQKKNTDSEVTEQSIVLPQKKTWDKLAVLQALASTVNRDHTAVHYMFQDDPYLIPRTSSEFRLFSLSKESGENAAKYIVTTHPRFFEKDIAEPHIPCLMPENLALQLEEVSEAALKERIQLRKVKASVNMYDQLLQSGTCISLETSNSLLDLLCFYGDKEPAQENCRGDKELAEQEEDAVERKLRRNFQNTFSSLGIQWRETNNAERIFNLMPEKNAHSYCTVIRGMVKHRAYARSFEMYTDLLNNRLKADVHTFNVLILAAGEVKEKYTEKWELVQDLLRQMAQQNVQPNLLTFNSVLKVLRWCGSLGRSVAVQTLSEMNALNIEPSLATFDHLLGIFYKSAVSARGTTEIIYEIIDEIEGKRFYPKDPDDTSFFSDAMRVCLDLKDVQLAYALHRVVETGDNWKMMGNVAQRTSYCGRFVNLLCLMEQLDVVLKWYKELVPSMFYPHSQLMLDLLQALDTANQLEMIPWIWKDIKNFGHGHRSAVVEEVLALMARDTQLPETQVAFADCAADIKSIYEKKEKSRTPLEWTASSLGNTAILFARSGRTAEAWNVLELFKKQNRVPSDLLMNEILNSIKHSNHSAQALELVKLAADFSLQSTSSLAKRVQEEFQLSEEQRKALDGMTSESDGNNTE